MNKITKPFSEKSSAASKSILLEPPSISLPKGGGAIKSIDEKFSVNPINGGSSFSVPLPFSPSRNAFVPALTLSYNSGAGNGIFGLGWSIDIPSITRKTEKELPLYHDAVESDTFIYTGTEDLVPVLDISLVRKVRKAGTTTCYPYYSRIESSFARIERIVESDNNVYWRVTTRENVTMIFGRSKKARIADPSDTTKIYKWLLEFSFDDKGNCYHFVYKPEDLVNVSAAPHEANRLSGLALFSNTYLKSVRYCNAVHFVKDQVIPDWVKFLDNLDFLLELVLDYGEHDLKDPQPGDANLWKCRNDPFSEYRAGFEVRTYRYCHRVLMFHKFTELGNAPCLVRSLDLEYSIPSTAFTFLLSVIQTGYKRDSPVTYYSKSFPKVEFGYEPLRWDTTIKTISADNVANAPEGVDEKDYQWVDLYGEGIAGILTEQASTLFYKSNRGNGEFASAKVVAPTPSMSGLTSGAVQLMDVEANGKNFLVSNTQGGFFELTEDDEWMPFKNFRFMPNVNWQDPNLKMLDLNGDGLPDLLISEDDVFVWYASKGREGYEDYRRIAKPTDEEKGPAIVFSDTRQSIVLADMTGDGLADIVRIRNGEIVYWPNCGYGKFGVKVRMSNAPAFDASDTFNPRFVKLADLDGSGTTDILYVGKNQFQIYFNQSGNSWNEINIVKGIDPLPFPSIDNTSAISIVDLLGNGTGCITWSSPLPGNAVAPLRYIDLMGGKKPHVLTSYRNNLGKQVTLSYRSSTQFYLDAKKNGEPWVTKLPFPVQCLHLVETKDLISNTRFTSEYKYGHGYYDYAEREFRGFGFVEQKDIDLFSGNPLDQPPVITRTWHHTGASLNKEKILKQFEHEYFYNQPGIAFKEPQLKDALVDTNLAPDEWREALRSCKGMPLRVEVFTDDGSPVKNIPFTTTQQNCRIKRVQEKGDNKHAVFMVQERENLTFTYERNVNDPRITHTVNTVFDLYGNVLESAAVVYGRDKLIVDADLSAKDLAEQQKGYIVYTVNDFIKKDIITDSDYRLRVPCQITSFELTGFPSPAASTLFQPEEIQTLFNTSLSLNYEDDPDLSKKQKRAIETDRHYFKDNIGDLRLPFGEFQSRALPFASYKLAFTINHAKKISDNLISDALLLQAAYVKLPDAANAFDNPDNYWLNSGRQQFDAANFYEVVRVTDPFGKSTLITHDPIHHFYITTIEDPVKNKVSVTGFDFLTLLPFQFTDINNNVSEVSYDVLGIVAGSALKGKGGEGDSLVAFLPDISDAAITAFFNNPLANANVLLQGGHQPYSL